MDNAITHILHSALSHPDQRAGGNYVCMLFMDYSLAFNILVPSKLITKLWDLGLYSTICSWVQDFLTGWPQVVRAGSTSSPLITLSTGAPQGKVLSPCGHQQAGKV